MTPLQIGLIGCVLLFGLLFTSMPVGFAMLISGLVGFALIVSPQAATSMITAELFDTFSSYNLTVIPLFVLMGQVAFHAGISTRLFKTAYTWIGHFPGGLAMATIGACAGFGAISGSGPATAATMASVALPEMKRYHYSDELASGARLGKPGMLIPPSVVFIVYTMTNSHLFRRRCSGRYQYPFCFHSCPSSGSRHAFLAGRKPTERTVHRRTA